ncbi:MAG TPA: VanW family protein [Abditibacteriaceae bacterium]|jgi:hypothetical protein
MSNVPTRHAAVLFRTKATVLQMRRGARDVTSGVRAWPRPDGTGFNYVLAQSRSPLWNDASPAEVRLQKGKVQNLRAALRRLDGTIIPANELFSFWKQIGQATTRRGYVSGRLLREGCLIPAVGGGLCQLSNALYAAALDSGCEIVERWAHSQTVPGSSAAQGRDATVAWNYIDLRFRPQCEMQISAKLSHDELVVRFLARQPVAVQPLVPLSSLNAPTPLLNPAAHSCGSCGQSACFRHSPAQSTVEIDRTLWLLDEEWPEFEELAKQKAHEIWTPDNAGWRRWYRGAATRFAGEGAAKRAASLQGTARIAGYFAHRIDYETTHLVVAQGFLPFLWQQGALGGRSFDVLMTRLPLHELHARLDEASLRIAAPTLRDFRAPQNVVNVEREALAHARTLWTPHKALAAMFPHAQRLPWHEPKTEKQTSAISDAIFFPGPAVARNGCHAVREAALALDIEVWASGVSHEGIDFWKPAKMRVTTNWREALAVVMPSVWDNSPRLLMRALAAGVPVIATAGCGIEPREGLYLVPFGDSDSICSAIEDIREVRSKSTGLCETAPTC